MTDLKPVKQPMRLCIHWYADKFPFFNIIYSFLEQLDTCLSKLTLRDFLGRVIPGLADDSDEIKVICHMMLFRLSQVAPASVSVRLDEATPFLEKTMKGVSVTKDTVKQDIERAAELQRSTLRAVAALSKISNSGAPKFDAFVEELKKSPQWGADFKEMIGA